MMNNEMISGEEKQIIKPAPCRRSLIAPVQVFVDMDGVIADFQRGVDGSAEVQYLKEEAQRYIGTIPNPFAPVELGHNVLSTMSSSPASSSSSSSFSVATASSLSSSSPVSNLSVGQSETFPTGTFASGETITFDDLTELLRANQNEPKGKMRPQLATLKSYIKRYRNAVFKVATKRGFFQNLEPIDYDGARQLMEDIYRLSGSKPHLLTAPVNTAYCASEKKWWAQHHFGGLYDQFYCMDGKGLDRD